MYTKKIENIIEGLTFDDVLVIPSRSSIEPKESDIKSKFSRHISLNTPVSSAPMDTVTEAEMAVAMSRYGGIGIIHRNISRNEQASLVRKVKREESIIIRNVHTVDPSTPIEVVRNIMETKKINGLPVVSGEKIVGIVTKRDLEFATRAMNTVSDVMVKDVIYASDNITLEEAREILYKNRIEKLPLVDDKKKVVGLITSKDITTRHKFPEATRDEEGQLMVGASVGPFDIDRAIMLEKEGADVIVIDTAHAHNSNVIESIKKMRKVISADIVAGNIATGEAAEDLISLDVDGLRVGIGPGSICTTRVVAGIGVPQISAIASVASVAVKSNIPVIADGGIRFSGDIVKAIAAGADTVMLGSLLAGTEESPGNEIIINGRKYKSYRGMGSIGAMQKGSDRYGKFSGSKFVAEGVEGAVPYRGKVEEVLFQLMGGLKSGMGYSGSRNIQELKNGTRFIRVTANGLRENHPHDIRIMTEPPNYQTFFQ
ncbi:MAG: IMP dehydrogenase [Candidatus Thermoplasmatota archaeon]|jgi:IMP dehydrogenase|nr:IMP dehydrogenase [Candidatus Thermoplasmatota archaeon]MCL5787018.1 IMP dehydrogenase [Candidatus Thermoplasmatota archaeon]